MARGEKPDFIAKLRTEGGLIFQRWRKQRYGTGSGWLFAIRSEH